MVDGSRCEVFLVGRYFCDLIFMDLPEFPRLGHEVYSRSFRLMPGGVFTPAVVLHRLGIKTVWPCTFGNDPFSRYVRDQALAEGLDSTLFEDGDEPSLRITTAFSFKNERAFLSYTDPLPKYNYGAFIRETKPNWVYITHLVLGNELEVLTAAAKAVGAKVYMDCQAHTHTLKEPLVQDALGGADIFSPNLEEARKLTARMDISAVFGELLKFVPTVIIKDGVNGCHFQNGNQNFHQAGIETEVIDTTGAGDNFNCGFLYGQLRNYSIRESLRIANICGGLSAGGPGGTSTSPTEKSLLKDWLTV